MIVNVKSDAAGDIGSIPIYPILREYPSGDGAVLIKQLPVVRFQPLVFGHRGVMVTQ